MATDLANYIAEIGRLRDEVKRLRKGDGYDEGFEDGERAALKEFEWASKRVDELEDLIADFFRGVADAGDLRKAVSA